MTLVTLLIGVLGNESKEKTPSVSVRRCDDSSNEFLSCSPLVPRNAAGRSAALVASMIR